MTDTDLGFEGMFDDSRLSLMNPDVLFDQTADSIELDELPERKRGQDAHSMERRKETPIKRMDDVVQGIFITTTNTQSLEL